MPLDEPAKTPLGSDLAEGVKAISLNQTVTFTRYVRLVLPLDGYVFWVKADLVSQSALFNALGLNAVDPRTKVPGDDGTLPLAIALNTPPKVITPATTLTVQGSMHYATDTLQGQDENYGVNRMVFTSLAEVQDLNQVGPNEMWVGDFDGLKFAFSSRSSFYRQAGLWHYRGNAVYPDMATQLVDSIVGFDQRLVVSNSLPAWLFLNGYRPFYGFGNPSLVLYPSFLMPANLPPPFAAVHIDPAGTAAIGGAPVLGPTSSHSQLVSDRVTITLWGTRNFNALDFVDCVNQYSLDLDVIGIMNQPVVRDEKRTQTELGTIAMKKSVVFEVCYYQERINDVARQMITEAIPSFIVGDQVAA